MATILNTQNLSVGYSRGHEKVTLLNGLNLSLEEGSLVALLGRNGAGKSTLLRALTNSDRPIEGSVIINGCEISGISLKERSRLIGLVATDHIAAGGLTVTELVEMGRQPHTGFLGRLNKDDKQIVSDAIESVGMTHKANSYVAQLSDGERQKCMIARALAQQTPIIILDEPTAFLDVASRIETMRLLHKLAHEQNKAVLLSSHDVSQSLMLADSLWLITAERNVVQGTPQELIASGAMNTLFDNKNIEFNPSILDYQHK